MAKTIGLTFPPEEIKEIKELEGAAFSVDGDIDLDNMTVVQLRQFAADNGIDIGSAVKKADIIQAIIGTAEADDTEV